MAISNERKRLADYLALEDPGVVADYISKTPKIQSALLDFYGPDLDMDKLVEGLRTSKGRKLEQIRDFVDNFLEVRAGKLPTGRLPAKVRWRATRDDGYESASEAKSSFAKAVRAASRISGLPAAFYHASSLMYHASAASLSFINLTKRERRLGMLVGMEMVAAAALTGQSEAAIDQSGIEDAINEAARPRIEESMGAMTKPEFQDGLSGYFGKAQKPAQTEYLLSPYLVKKLEKDSNARQYLKWIFQEAKKFKLDPVLFANQMFRESNHFKDTIVYGPEKSSAGAMGIAQIIKGKGAEYGLHREKDFFDPQKSIAAAARIMHDFLKAYKGDKILALAAYNGGEGAVNYVRERMGRKNISGKEWLDFMNKRHEELGKTSGSAWHVQTREYIADITNLGWENTYRSWAKKLQGRNGLQYFAQIAQPKMPGQHSAEHIIR